jgi:hypothetical protein
MSRSNTRAEFLERENKFLREQIAKISSPPGEIPFHACDNSCAVTRPTGVATNGGCRCDDEKLRNAIGWWRRYATYLRATIEMLKNGNAVETWDRALEMLAKSGHAPKGYEPRT